MAARAALRGQARVAVVCALSEKGESQMICPNGFTTCCGNSRACFHPDRGRLRTEGMTNRQDDSGALREQLVRVFAELHEAWDADKDSRVGKMLAALLDPTINYLPSITQVHKTIAALSPQGSEPAGVGEPVARVGISSEGAVSVSMNLHQRAQLVAIGPCDLYATPAPAQQAVTDGVTIPRDEVMRIVQVLRYAAHPQPSPHADALNAYLAPANTTAPGASDA